MRSLPWLLLAILLGAARSEDLSFECPATTVCPLICVANADECPTACANDAVLCDDGSCQAECSANNAYNPCPDCLPYACAQVEDYYDVCLEDYAEYYQAHEDCHEQENQRASLSTQPLTLLGLWLVAATAASLLWTQSQRLETKQLEDRSTQTGFRRTWMGLLLYYALVVNLLGFQVLLLHFTIQSYRGNEVEALRAFEITWCLGLVWTLLYKWPYSIQSLCYRACPLHEATHVCIVTESGPPDTTVTKNDPLYLQRIRAFLAFLHVYSNAAMARLFRMPSTGKQTFAPVQLDANGIHYIVFQFRRYNYSAEADGFVPGTLVVLDTLEHLPVEGLSSELAEERLHVVGPNVIEMKRPSFLSSFSNEFSRPFYTYQLYMLWTWMPLDYYYMGIVHGSVIAAGGIALSWFRFRNESNLYQLTNVAGQIEVLRDGREVVVSQTNVVPGDIVIVQPGPVYCDMLLVESEGLLVDESALTGESTPMVKTQVSPSSTLFNPLVHKKHFIAAGTTVLESEKRNLALVVTTGSFTSKGELLRGVFQYERHQFKFDVEVGLVLAILVVEAILGFALVVHLIRDQAVYAWFYGMFVVGVILPPLLPTVFTVSVGASDTRLTKKSIVCSNSEDILVAGKVKRAFFDKTGTLTRQGLDFISARCTHTWGTDSKNLSDDIQLAMAVCHGITVASDGQIIGNPVDQIMFDASGALFEAGSARLITSRTGQQTEVLRMFDFDHHRMTQSVIVRTNGKTRVFVKGSGESIQGLCIPETLPEDFDMVVRDSAKSGTYQISVATKDLEGNEDLSSITRDDVECGLSFVGVLNFKNVLRDETPSVIRELEAGEVRCAMITGDSVLTGVRIAKESGIIGSDVKTLVCTEFDDVAGIFQWLDDDDKEAELPSIEMLRSGASGVTLAVSGDVWDAFHKHRPHDVVDLANSIRVFGRCSPLHKVSVVSTFVDQGFITLMCGDGGNDCGALKTAHVGIALSDAEASIVSPFTSLDKSIGSVVEILKEGRCALASALASYKYIIMYGQIEAMNNIINAYFRTNFSEWCWIFLDGFWVIGMGFTLPLAKAARSLAQTRPTSSLLGPHTVSSIVGILLTNMIFAVLSLVALFHQDWFQCRQWENNDVSNLAVIGDNYESTTVFLVTGYQYISSAMAWNFGYEFRTGWWHNRYFVALVLAFTTLHFYVTLVPGTLSCLFRVNCDNDHVLYTFTEGRVLPIQNPFHTTVMPLSYRVILIVLMVSNTLCNMCWDYFVVNGLRQRWGAQKRRPNEVPCEGVYELFVDQKFC